MKTWNWEAFCRKDRIAAISETENIVNRYASILDFHRFSDIALELTIEIDNSKAEALFKALNAIMTVTGDVPTASEANKESLIYINMRFAKGTGDLSIPVPEVPG